LITFKLYLMIFLLNLIGRGNSTAVVCGMVNPMAEAVFPEGMPVMDGVEAARALRKLDGKYYREVPVIALTANTGTEQQREYAEAEMNGYLSKPFELEELYAVLEKWLDCQAIPQPRAPG